MPRQEVLSVPVQVGEPPDESRLIAAGTRAGGVYMPATEPISPEPVSSNVFFAPNYAPSASYHTALRYTLNLPEGEISELHTKIYEQTLRRRNLPLRNRAVSSLGDNIIIDSLPLATRELAVIPGAYNTIEPFGEFGHPPGSTLYILDLKFNR